MQIFNNSEVARFMDVLSISLIFPENVKDRLDYENNFMEMA